MVSDGIRPGTFIIFRKLKHGNSPGPWARAVTPELRGEGYRYHVDKFWVVLEQRGEDTLLVLTRSGKRHVVDRRDPNLRRANWWERMWFRHRFPAPPPSVERHPSTPLPQM